MKEIKTISELTELIESIHASNENKKTVVLIGGFARVGKTTLSSELSKNLTHKKIENKVVCLDSWLLSHNKRKAGSKVIERYQTKEMIEALRSIINGFEIFPPKFDPVTRMQIKVKGIDPVKFDMGILIIEGTIALSFNELNELASLKININISSCTRLKRLLYFYKSVKQLPREEYKQLISRREKEEIPFIREASKNADIVYTC